MSSSPLLDSAFKRICAFVEKSGFKIRNTEFGVAFYFYPNTILFNYDWAWANKKELFLGSNINGHGHVYSLFSSIIARYEYFKTYNIKNSEPLSEPISENMSNFIDVCRFLNGCDSIEEVALKMALMRI